MIFTDYYGEQSCTAGRSSFIMGQSVFRTGLSKVACRAPTWECEIEDPTIAGLLKDQGYATGQFGKNHLGDRDEHLPTNHGFDEFLGNLYHLNAEEEPENEDYPADRDRRRIRHSGKVRAAGCHPVLCRRQDRRYRTADQKADGNDRRRDRCGGHGLHRTTARRPANRSSVWWNGTRMHFRTHVKEEHRGISGRTSIQTAWSSTTCTSASC